MCIQVSNSVAESMAEDGWVVCRVFKKKNYQKALESPKSSSMSMDSNNELLASRNDEVLDQILMYMGRTCKLENEAFNNINISDHNSNSLRFLTAKQTSNINELHDRFMHLPRLESPTLPSLPINNSPFDHQDHSFKACYQSFDDMLTETEPPPTIQGAAGCDNHTTPIDHDPKTRLSDWVAFDRMVASQLNGQEETSKQLSCFSDTNMAFCAPHHDDVQLQDLRSSRLGQLSQVYNTENDIWSFTKSSSPSSSDPLSHLSV